MNNPFKKKIVPPKATYQTSFQKEKEEASQEIKSKKLLNEGGSQRRDPPKIKLFEEIDGKIKVENFNHPIKKKLKSSKERVNKQGFNFNPKASILLKSLIQPLAFIVYFHENSLSGEIQFSLAPIISFMLGGSVNLALVLYGHWRTVFMSVQSLIIVGSLLFSIYANQDKTIFLEISQQHEKMTMAFMFLLILFSTNLDIKSSFSKIIMIIITIALASIYQVIFFRSSRDFFAQLLFNTISYFSIWNLQKELEEMQNKKEKSLSPQNLDQNEVYKNQVKLFQSALKDGVKDCVFFTVLEGIDSYSSNLEQSQQTASSVYPKLNFYEKNGKLLETFNLSSGFDSFLQKMNLTRKDQIIAVQKRIVKLMREPFPSALEYTLKKLTFLSKVNRSKSLANQSHLNLMQQNSPKVNLSIQHNFNNSHYIQSNNFLQSSDQFISEFPSNQKGTVPLLEGFSNTTWKLQQLTQFVSLVRQAKKSTTFNEVEICSQQKVNTFNLQELILISFFSLNKKAQKSKSLRNGEISKFLNLFLKDQEFKYLSRNYQASLFSCQFNQQDALFISINKLFQNNKVLQKQQTFSRVNEESGYNSNFKQILQFFKNRTEKISKSITASLCRLDCFRIQEEDEKKSDKQKSSSFLLTNFEYMRMIAKDTEEYRELLEEQIKFKEKESVMSRDGKGRLSKINLSRFKLQQVIDEVKEIFKMEISFKSTQIYLRSQKYLSQQIISNENIMQEENDMIQSDYEKIKRVLIILIENSLIYQKAGTIEIEVVEENYNTLCIKIIDNQCMNICDQDIQYINQNGQSLKGFGFAIASALLNPLKPKDMPQNPLQVQKDFQNDKSNVVFYLAKILKDEFQEQQSFIPSNFAINNNNIERNQFILEEQSIVQQNAIDNLIVQKRDAFNMNSHELPNVHHQQSRIPYAPHQNIQQPQNDTNILFQAFQIRMRNILSSSPSPLQFNNNFQFSCFGNHKCLDNFQLSSPQLPTSKAKMNLIHTLLGQKSPKQNQMQNIKSNISTWGKRGSNTSNQLWKPQFLVVSWDFRISASLNDLLTKMSGDASSVKFASNKLSLIELLKSFIFEYILIDCLEGVCLKDIFILINGSYKNKKQIQKIIFFDYSQPQSKNLETQIPLLASHDFNNQKGFANKDDLRLEFLRLYPSDIVFPSNKMNNNSTGKKTNQPKIPKRRLSYTSIDTLNTSISIPSETSFNNPTTRNQLFKGIVGVNYESNKNPNSEKKLVLNDIDTLKLQQLLLTSPKELDQLNQATYKYEQKFLNSDKYLQKFNFDSATYLIEEVNQLQVLKSDEDISKKHLNQNMNMNIINEGAIPSDLEQEFQQQRKLSVNQSQQNQERQDFIKSSFVPRYNESIEVASNLKFAYYSLEHPFGYAQILEAICHLHFSTNMIHLNNNFFNLNKPELYFSQ